MKSISLSIPVLMAGILILSGGSFYGGIKYQFSKTPTQTSAPGQRDFANRVGAMRGSGSQRGGNGFVSGPILSKDTNTLTITDRSGGSKIVIFSSSTKIGKIADGTLNDLVTGTDVVVNGTANPDGSITATMVQVRPAQSIPQGQQPAR